MASTSQLPVPLRLSAEGAEIFRQSVKFLITEWPSLKLAIENGQGGRHANEKREWIISNVAQVMIDDKNVDLEDYLGEMINQEFDTLIEDGSLEYNTKWIEKFYKDCLEGRGQSVVEAISNVSIKMKNSYANCPPPVCQTEESSEDSDYGEEEDG